MVWNPSGLRTICVDFNGVLDTYKGYNNGQEYPPRAGALAFLRSLKHQGYKVVIMTSATVWKVKIWLAKYEMDKYVDDVSNQKVPAIIYVDDRAIPFKGDFVSVLDQIEHFKTFWEVDGVQETPNAPNAIPNDNPSVEPPEYFW